MRVLILFVDGVGLGSSDPAVNPLAAADLPVLRGLLEGRAPVADAAPFHGASASLVGIDATLGVAGTPQSGTGHAALLTGEDAVRMFGRHQGPWVPTALRPMVAERSVLARAKAAGLRVAFANAYPEELVERAAEEGVAGRRLGPLRAGPPMAALGAGVLTRHTAALERGDAVATEITNDGWIRHLGRTSLPRLDPPAAGRNLAGIARAHDLTLFAHYTTDTVGHRGTFQEAVASIEKVDGFLGGVLEGRPGDLLVVVVSDHGNLEDPSVQHTRNPALGVVVGAGHREFAERMVDLTRVVPLVLERLLPA
ncbi:MAG: alkaline phosphatase family protein [Gemmatimonadetes bacterium]|nr:alkaline phosphatase family protein [Gemmatimonadota bacterium]